MEVVFVVAQHRVLGGAGENPSARGGCNASLVIHFISDLVKMIFQLFSNLNNPHASIL